MRTIAIVGAGFTGTMVAVHLLQSLREPARLLLFERTGRFTAGVAYGTSSPAHVLNIPAGRMSAFEGDADHFLRWAKAVDPGVSGGTFVLRRLYGDYLADTLARAEAGADPAVRLERVAAAVVGLGPVDRRPDRGVRLDLAGGREHKADLAVLAIGNYPPSDPPVADPAFYAGARYARDPWADGALRVPPTEPVLLLGTGLTMVDMALALDEQGHRGPIHAVSRRGLRPQAHRAATRPPPPHDRPPTIDAWPATARGLLRALRCEVERAARRGVDWREVLTSIRADTPALWASLPPGERDRFLRHLRPYWETHRHRMAPGPAARIERLIAGGRLNVVAGRIAGYREDGSGVSVEVIERRGGRMRKIRAARVVNCTGPETDLRRVDDPLVRQLVRDGLVCADVHGLGLDSTPEGALVDAAGRVHGLLWLVGPLRKGQRWENTAVPELRTEVEALARRLAAAGRGPAE